MGAKINMENNIDKLKMENRRLRQDVSELRKDVSELQDKVGGGYLLDEKFTPPVEKRKKTTRKVKVIATT